MIDTLRFGRTGHESTRLIFGAAALGGMRQEKADQTLELVLESGINHIDTAASYGRAEERLRPFLRDHRRDVFLATKAGARDAAGARESLHRSLERMGVDQVDLIQLHNLVPEEDWRQALAPGGALEALVEAREQGLTRFIGVTGHGLQVAAMHLRSLERFDFDSVLLPCSHSMLAQPEYARDFDALVALCAERDVAVQTIKAIARRRWPNPPPERRFSWYEPLRDPAAIRRAVAFVLRRPGLFLNTTSDATLLPEVLAAGREVSDLPSPEAMEADAARHAIEPLFVPGGPQGV